MVGGFPSTTSKGEIASFWMQMQLLGDAVAEKSGAFFPGMDWELDEAETCALFSATPFTTDEIMLGRIVAFAEASRRLVVPDDSLEDRTRFRAVLIELAKESRQEWIEAVDRAAGSGAASGWSTSPPAGSGSSIRATSRRSAGR